MLFSPEDFPQTLFKRDIPLSAVTSMRCGGIAAFAAYPSSGEAFVRLLSFLTSASLPFRVQGRMTNTLPPDGRYEGVLVFTDRMRSVSRTEDTVTLGAGCLLTAQAFAFARRGISLFPSLCTVPGTVGGAVRGNAGAYGAEIADSFIFARAWNAHTGKIEIYRREELAFSYRDSRLKHEPLYLIDAVFRVTSADADTLLAQMRGQKERRAQAQPLDVPSLGSIFLKNNAVSAAWYIDRAGLKGLRIGGAEVSPKHAGFIVNAGGASSADIRRLAEEVRRRVFLTFGVMLKTEIEILPENG